MPVHGQPVLQNLGNLGTKNLGSNQDGRKRISFYPVANELSSLLWDYFVLVFVTVLSLLMVFAIELYAIWEKEVR